jgi:hypothetical protein
MMITTQPETKVRKPSTNTSHITIEFSFSRDCNSHDQSPLACYGMSRTGVWDSGNPA